jgi:MiaB/RimO family radical SAM methylthiotransferase
MARIHIITFGCTLNQADSELMAGLLKQAGHTLTSGPDSAELVIINSCTVKEQAELKLDRAIRDVRKGRDDLPILLAGCVTQAEKSYLMTKYKNFSVIGTQQLNRINEVVSETLGGNVIHILNSGTNQRFNLPIIRRNPVIGIIPIAEGCLGSCTYCKARFARGTLKSYPLNKILDQIKLHLSQGCKEIWLTAQDCGAYGKDSDQSIVTLLRTLTGSPGKAYKHAVFERALPAKGDYKIRIGMFNPQYALEYLDDMITLFKDNPHLFRFIHIPVQAGSNRILKLMGRKYTKEDFIKVCTQLRQHIPDITIATDIICGFPSETEAEFEETLDLIRTVKPDVLNRSRFWPRPGTKAASLPGQLHGRDTNRRSRILEEEFRKIAAEHNKIWNSRTCTIIIDEKGKDKGGSHTWIGRNQSYRPVGVKGDFSLGEKVKVRITETHPTYLSGEIIE